MAGSGIPELLELRSTNLGSLELEGESKPDDQVEKRVRCWEAKRKHQVKRSKS